MLNKDFFTKLEHKICNTFQNEKDTKLKKLWCDGVCLPENESSNYRERILSTSKIELKAWFGQTGQEVYKLILNLGKTSKQRVLLGKEIVSCIPNIDDDWIYLDSENKILEITLN